MKKRTLALLLLFMIFLVSGCGFDPDYVPVEVDGTILSEADRLGFRFGTVVSPENLKDESYRKMVLSHFNTITAGNEMKAYSLLVQQSSMTDPNGRPVMNYEKGDDIAAFAKENGLKVRGHVLVWHAYMCDCFFREGYKNSGAYVDSDTARERLRYYIDEVITHFETKFPGVVTCWDVVNEAVGDSEKDYDDSDERHIRTVGGSVANQFYYVIGDDYVEYAFRCAKETVEKLQKTNPDVSIKLFYNDYNTFYPEKRDAICALLKSINSCTQNEDGTDKKLCDGVGMQCYIGGYGIQNGCMEPDDISLVTESAKIYHDLSLDVHITEMAVRNYKRTEEETHAKFYAELMREIALLNKDESVMQNVSIWGIKDNPYAPKSDYSYIQNSPFCGLFDEKCRIKNDYAAVLEALKGIE